LFTNEYDCLRLGLDSVSIIGHKNLVEMLH